MKGSLRSGWIKQSKLKRLFKEFKREAEEFKKKKKNYQPGRSIADAISGGQKRYRDPSHV